MHPFAADERCECLEVTEIAASESFGTCIVEESEQAVAEPGIAGHFLGKSFAGGVGSDYDHTGISAAMPAVEFQHGARDYAHRHKACREHGVEYGKCAGCHAVDAQQRQCSKEEQRMQRYVAESLPGDGIELHGSVGGVA